MHHYPEDQSTDNLAKVRRENRCSQCGRQLAIYYDLTIKSKYIACSGQVHEGITREYKPPVEDYQSNIRRATEMEQEHGVGVTTKLAKYQGVLSLDKVGAREIITTVFPDAPEAEVAKAILLCVNYQLNPLMNHVYLIPFQKRENGKVVGTDWATVIGRGAKRLMASRRGPYSYIDNTPRVMTQQEQLDTLGEYDEDKLWCITKLKDPKTGATSVGYGFWPKTKPVYGKPDERQPNQPKGTDKGNSMFNMGSGRSESQALDRLRPGEMPMNVAVMDEGLAEQALDGTLEAGDYIEGESRVLTEEAEVKIIGGEVTNVGDDKTPPTVITTQKEDEIPQPEPEATESTGDGDKGDKDSKPKPKDESPVTQEDIDALMALMDKAGKTPTDVGQMMSKELKWEVPSKFLELKKWQVEKLTDILNKALGQ